MRKREWIVFAIGCILCLQARGRWGTGGVAMAFEISSSAFQPGKMIPRRYTCDGENISPSLSWSAPPKGTKSYALICEDPDAPAGTWVHWVVYNIPVESNGLPEVVSHQEQLADGTRQGMTDFKRVGYGGPCPPGGTHRYFFKLYALDRKVDLPPGADKKRLLQEMEGHILGETALIGHYKR